MARVSLKGKERKALLEFVSRVKRSLGGNLASIRLYGSKARGEGKADSDIDVLVAVHRLSSNVKNQVIDAAFDINLEFGVFISPRVVPARIFSIQLWRMTPFVSNVVKEGIRL